MSTVKDDLLKEALKKQYVSKYVIGIVDFVSNSVALTTLRHPTGHPHPRHRPREVNQHRSFGRKLGQNDFLFSWP